MRLLALCSLLFIFSGTLPTLTQANIDNSGLKNDSSIRPSNEEFWNGDSNSNANLLRRLDDSNYISATSQLVFTGSRVIHDAAEISFSTDITGLDTAQWVGFAVPIVDTAKDPPSVTTLVQNGKLQLKVAKFCGDSIPDPVPVNWMVLRVGTFVSVADPPFTIQVGIRTVTVSKTAKTVKINFSNGSDEPLFVNKPPLVIAQVQALESLKSSIIVTAVDAQHFEATIETSFRGQLTIGYVAVTPGEIPISNRVNLYTSKEITDSSATYTSRYAAQFNCGPIFMLAGAYFDTGVQDLNDPIGFSINQQAMSSTATIKATSFSCGIVSSSSKPVPNLNFAALQMTSNHYCNQYAIGEMGLRDINSPTPDPNAEGHATTKPPTKLIWLIIGGIIAVALFSVALYFLCRPKSRYSTSFDGSGNGLGQQSSYPKGVQPTGPFNQQPIAGF